MKRFEEKTLKEIVESEDTFLDIILVENLSFLKLKEKVDLEKILEKAEKIVHKIFAKLKHVVNEEYHDDDCYIATCNNIDKEIVLAFVKELSGKFSADVFESNDEYASVGNLVLGDLCKAVGIDCDDFIVSDIPCEVGFNPKIVD